MATISATTLASSITGTSLVLKKRPVGVSFSPILGLPSMAKVGGRVKCTMEGKNNTSISSSSSSKPNMGSLMAATLAATMATSPAAMALVDERMSTEGTGLPFGLSNNILGWILLGVFAFIWSFYTVYTSGLDEDEESGLSL